MDETLNRCNLGYLQNFESEQFRYNLKDLISQYYKENEILIDPNFVDLLYNIFIKIKKDAISNRGKILIDIKIMKKIKMQ